ncbi:MAG: hypothetical protein E3J54_03330 [Actinobacteria bacterium]|nr:MAG: hypothetical protein E3J54_03330 [Actinomycetota bacterium]
MDMSIPQVVEKISDLKENMDKRFDILSKQIYDVTTRLDSMENNISLRHKENLEYKDEVMKLLTRHDQEIVSINSRLKRI